MKIENKLKRFINKFVGTDNELTIVNKKIIWPGGTIDGDDYDVVDIDEFVKKIIKTIGIKD